MNFSIVIQLKNTKVGLLGSQEMHILLFEKWAYANKNEEQPGGFAKRVFKK